MKTGSVVIWSIVFSLSFLLASCALVEDVTENSSQAVTVINDDSTLDDEIEVVNQEISVGDTDEDTALFRSQLSAVSAEEKFRLTLVGELDAPIVSETQTKAASIFLRGSHAYVAYNVEGGVQRGASDIISVGNETKPELRSRLLFKDRDVNAITSRGRWIFLTGARQDGEPYLTRDRRRGNRFSGEFETLTLPSLAGNSLAIDNKRVFVSTGDVGGGVFVFDFKSLDGIAKYAIEDARSVRSNGGNNGNLQILAGQPARIFNLDKRRLDEEPELLIEIEDTLTIPESKARVVAGGIYVMASLGDGGFGVICRKTGELLTRIDQVDLTGSGVPLDNTVTNSIAIYKNLIFTANGEAGVRAYQIETGGKISGSRCRSISLSSFGRLSLGGDLSANDLSYKNNHLFVATSDGLKIIRVQRLEIEDDFDDFDDDEDEDDD